MPLIGFGTWKLRHGQAREAVLAALAVGYRHVDTATMYGNEADVGQALAESGLDRAEVFVTTKIRPSDAGRAGDILRQSLQALRTDYLDLWLVHWPPPRRGMIRTSPPSSRSVARSEPRSRPSRRRKRRAATPGCAFCILSIPTGACRSMSPTSS